MNTKFRIKMNLKKLLILGSFFVLACQNTTTTIDRKVAGVKESIYQLGLYSEDLKEQSFANKDRSIQVFFNLPPYTHPGNIGLTSNMIQKIDRAETSIRMAMFQFNHKEIFQSLKRAVDRGVKVYISTDLCYRGKTGYKEYFDELAEAMKSKGMDPASYIVDDKTVSCDGAFNHNKYMIIDFEDKNKASAWFGSFNPTNHGSVENVELAIYAKNFMIAEVLMLDFEQLIAGVSKVNKKGVYSIYRNGKVESIALSEKEVVDFINKGTKVSYPKITIGEDEFEFIFSPKVKSLTRIIEEIYAAKSKIHFSSFAIADQMLISAILNKAYGENKFPVVALSHPEDPEEFVIRSNPGTNQASQKVIWKKTAEQKKPNEDVNKILLQVGNDVKNSLITSSNYLTPNGTIKSTYQYIYPKGSAGGKVEKVEIEGIFNNKIIDEKNTYQRMIGTPIKLFRSQLNGELHNKLFLIDQDKIIFGSHNFSQAAENGNDELTVIIKSERINYLLTNELFEKTKLFSVPANLSIEDISSEDLAFASIKITEILSESQFKKKINNKIIDMGDFVEIYNYGDREVQLYGMRLDDRFFPSAENEVFDLATNPGVSGELVAFMPGGNPGDIGAAVFNPELTILKPKKLALVVGKYFHPSFYKQEFERLFTLKNKRSPKPDEYPILVTIGPYFSSTLGDATTGLSSRDKVSLYGIDNFQVIDRFEFPIVDPRLKKDPQFSYSVERIVSQNSLVDTLSNRELVTRKFKLKNQVEQVDQFFGKSENYSKKNDWAVFEGYKFGTPGILRLNNNRDIASVESLFILGKIADAEKNEFKTGVIEVLNGEIKNIYSENAKELVGQKIIKTNSLIFPGLIDGHNHIKYNFFPLWQTSQTYLNRYQWSGVSVYQNGIKEMYKQVYETWPECLKLGSEAEIQKCQAKKKCEVITYGEIKALLGGTTAIQGSSSFDESTSDFTFRGLTPYYIGSGNKKGLSKARVLEDLLDECTSDFAKNIERMKINGADEVRTTAQPITSDGFGSKMLNDSKKFQSSGSAKLIQELKREKSEKFVEKTRTFYVHLSEGTDQDSNSEFNLFLKLGLNVAGSELIHATALKESDFLKVADNKMGIVWSPTSNLLLYKSTTDIPSALNKKIPVSLGSDWSLSGTKHLIDELKIAKKTYGGKISDSDLFKMVTINPAKQLGLSDKMGNLKANSNADFFLVSDKLLKNSPAETLLNLESEDVTSTFVNGKLIVGNEDSFKLFNINKGFKININDCDDRFINLEATSKNVGQMLSEIEKKVKSAYDSLKPKFKKELSEAFSRPDNLCNKKDSRYQSILNGI